MRNYNKFVVDIDNLRCNITLIKRLLKDNVRLCAVVKADAYGLGVDTIVKAIDDYVDYYAVSNVFEAKQIREIGVNTNILILGSTPLQEINYCAKKNITISVDSLDYIKAFYNSLHSSVKVHLKFNTGLNRYGFKELSKIKECVKYISNHKKIILEGVFTHFATKKEDVEYMSIQKKIFDEFCAVIPKGVIRHCANSFATLYSSTNQYDMVRVGINMYGDLRGENLPLKDVLRIESEIVAINSVKKYQSVGYDRTFVANRNSKIAVVPLGYADGISRRASNKFYMIVNGQKANIVGNVCMDCCMIDVTDIGNVFVGTPVVVVGDYGENKVSVLDWANATNTSPYDTLLNFRYRRCEYIVNSKT